MKKKFPSQNLLEKIEHILYEKKLHSRNEISIKNKRPREFSFEERRRIVLVGQSSSFKVGDICVKYGITPAIFYNWSQEFLNNEDLNSQKERGITNYFSDDDKYRIVLEGNNGEFSIPEICRRENISQNQFLQWSDEFLQIRAKRIQREVNKDKRTSEVRDLIMEFSGKNALNYFESFIDVTSVETKIINDFNTCDNIKNLKEFTNLVCLLKVNDIRFINKHFELINSKLNVGGVFVGCLETFSARRRRKGINKIPLINNIYFTGEFICKRILPKLDLTKKYYFNFTKGSDRLLSKAEGLGRLVSCGFNIMDYKTIDGILYFVVKKSREPYFDLSPSYGPVYKMPRLGKNGKMIGVYKFRTMHPYSEYIQDYIVNANGYSATGKPANDFRIPKWGKFLRKYWLDELPQLLNVLKGEMKLVGIRPVSKRYFQDIPKEMQKLRLTQKPGCIPPYVALNRKGNVMSVLNAEKEYLEDKIGNPYTTDIKYFFKAIFNIVFNNKRSA